MTYAVAPLCAWVVAGTLKFLINSLRSRRLAYDLIGYGGLPSTHATIVCTTAGLVGLRAGWNTPEFCVALAVTMIVIMDAASLRGRIGDHATALNRLTGDRPDFPRLRERMGHSPVELLAGAIVGAVCAYALSFFG